jgi:hypothetical protein
MKNKTNVENFYVGVAYFVVSCNIVSFANLINNLFLSDVQAAIKLDRLTACRTDGDRRRL